jgi:uncharacterized protein (TIGR02147 family)
MTTQLPEIFYYIDYRKYLEDYYLRKKALDPKFTHIYICTRLGQKYTKSYFNNIVKGRMDITATFIDRFISLLELKSDEAKFFRALVNYNQTQSPNEKEFFFDQLVRLNKTPHTIIDKNSYAFYKEWYHIAFRSLLEIIDFNDDYKFLSSRLIPPITVREARESIELLNRLGLIERNSQGFWKPTEKVIVTGDLVKEAVIRQFQMKCLDHAKTLLACDPVEGNRNVTMTLSMSEKAYERIAERIKQFKSEIRSIVHKDEFPPKSVYHINLNFFRMSAKE